MNSRPAKILYVEDEISFSSLVSIVLRERYAHEVDLAETGEDGVEKLKAKQYDLVFLDYRLPGMSGIDVLRWMKDNRIDTPVIMLTAAGSEGVAVDAMKLGAYDYIRKEQFELDHLPVLIYNALEHTILKRENNRLEEELHERAKQEAVVKMFQDTVRTLAHYINNSLATLSLRIQVFNRKIENELKGDQLQQVQDVLKAIQQDAKTIEAIMKSLTNVSNMVYAKYSGDQDIIEIRSDLDKALQELKQ